MTRTEIEIPSIALAQRGLRSIANAEMCRDSDGCRTWIVYDLPDGVGAGDLVDADAHSWYHDGPHRETFRLGSLFRSRTHGLAAYAQVEGRYDPDIEAAAIDAADEAYHERKEAGLL